MKRSLVFIFSLITTFIFAQDNTGTYMYPFVNDNKWGYINKEGDVLIPAMYEAAGFYYNGLASIKSKGKYGFIDTYNKMLIEPQFDSSSHFSEGFCAVAMFQKDLPTQWGYINTKGIPLETEIPSLGFASDFKEGRAIVSEEGFAEYRVINKNGKIIYKSGVDNYYLYEDPKNLYNNGLLRVQKVTSPGTYHTEFLDTMGKIVSGFNYQNYDDIGYAGENLFWVMKNGKFGLIDGKNKVILEEKYDTILSFSEGWARVSEGMQIDYSLGKLSGGTHQYIDSKGKTVIDPKSAMGFCFHNGYAKVYENGKWGFMNANGLIVIEAKFDNAEDFFRGLALVTNEGHLQYIDTKGKVIWYETKN